MDTKEFVNRVRELSGLDDRGEAKSASMAALAALSDALPQQEAHDLGSQLPKDFKDLIWSRREDPRPAKPLDWQVLLGNVRETLAPGNRDKASPVTRAIFTTLREAVTPGEMGEIAGVLPPELQGAG
mgnify:CR=1 FL=1